MEANQKWVTFISNKKEDVKKLEQPMYDFVQRMFLTDFDYDEEVDEYEEEIGVFVYHLNWDNQALQIMLESKLNITDDKWTIKVGEEKENSLHEWLEEHVGSSMDNSIVFTDLLLEFMNEYY